MRNVGIVRNRLKIEGAVRNAKAFLKVQTPSCRVTLLPENHLACP